MKKAIIAAVLTMATQNVFAVSCIEKVSKVVAHGNGEVYFNTTETCVNSWCQVNWTVGDSKKTALATLLTAKSTNADVVFQWPNLGSCDNQNPVFASPDYFIMQ